jgi:hypothetical protein
MLSEIRTSLNPEVLRIWVRGIGTGFRWRTIGCVPRFKPRTGLERSAAGDLWKNTLSKIPSLFGKLAYLASLRDPNSGIYRHHGLSMVFGREESSRVLRDNHEQAFFEWLNLSLAEKSADLGMYLNSLEDPPFTVLGHWSRSKTYSNHVPSATQEMERELFVKDLEALIETITNGPAGRGPGSSPPASPAQ